MRHRLIYGHRLALLGVSLGVATGNTAHTLEAYLEFIDLVASHGKLHWISQR